LRDGYDARNDWDWEDTPDEIAKAMLRQYPGQGQARQRGDPRPLEIDHQKPA
jgi:hypothetical protein